MSARIQVPSALGLVFNIREEVKTSRKNVLIWMTLAAGHIFYKKMQERFLHLEAQNNFFFSLSFSNFIFLGLYFSFNWKEQIPL